MRTVTFILVMLLICVLGGGAYFYLHVYRPLAQEYAAQQSSRPGLENALRKYQDRERQVRDWTVPLAGMLQNALAAEIAAGNAEVLLAGGEIVVNIAENVLYTPQSVLFAKDSRPFQRRLAGLCTAFKDKQILVGNSAEPAPAHGRGRRRVPARSARALASARSHELVKALIRNGVAEERLVEAAFSTKMPERSFTIKGSKTVLIISDPAPVKPLPALQPPPASAASATAAPAQQPQQQIPISIAPERH